VAEGRRFLARGNRRRARRRFLRSLRILPTDAARSGLSRTREPAPARDPAPEPAEAESAAPPPERAPPPPGLPENPFARDDAS